MCTYWLWHFRSYSYLPYLLLGKEGDIFGKRHVFWRIPSNFWPEEKITTWEVVIFPNGPEEAGMETTANMITLSADVHKLLEQRWIRT